MSPRYRHTQVGYLTVAVMIPAMVGAVLATRSRVPSLAIIAFVVLLVGVSVVFSSLTITVYDDALESSFALGFWRRRVPFADIADVSPASSAWWEGWGIRMTPRGMLYNVSGTRAVEVERTSGTRFRLGTDEPDALLGALEDAMRRRAASVAR